VRFIGSIATGAPTRTTGAPLEILACGDCFFVIGMYTNNGRSSSSAGTQIDLGRIASALKRGSLADLLKGERALDVRRGCAGGDPRV
jgi:hypothetical protein